MQCTNKKTGNVAKKLPHGSFFYSAGAETSVDAGSGRTSSGVSSTGFFFLQPMVNTKPA